MTITFSKSEFIRIPAGNYTIGLSDHVMEKAIGALQESVVKREYIANCWPEHIIHVNDVFIRKYLTSRSEYLIFAEDTGYETEGERQGWGWIWQDERWQKKSGVSWKAPYGTADDEWYGTDDNVPVMQVSWNDAKAYCEWLSVKWGHEARLPQESEWEIFARLCGVTGMNEWADRMFERTPQTPVTVPVHEISEVSEYAAGILWEWMEDWYDRYPGGGMHKDYGRVYKVLRGGSVLSLPVQRTREFRLRKCPTARSPYYGFRIVCAGSL